MLSDLQETERKRKENEQLGISSKNQQERNGELFICIYCKNRIRLEPEPITKKIKFGNWFFATSSSKHGRECANSYGHNYINVNYLKSLKK